MPDQALIERFVAAGPAYRSAAEELSDAQAKTRIEPGQWSILELVVHVADADAVSIDRMKRIVAEDRPQLLNFDETAYIERLLPHEQSLDDALTLLEVGRRQFAHVLRKLPDEALARVGVHNVRGDVSARELLSIITEHAEHHLDFLVKKRAALGLAPPGSE